MRILYSGCPLCSHPNFSPLREGSCKHNPLRREDFDPVIRWMRCGGCGHIFTDGYWGPEASAHIFADTKDIHEVGSDLDRTHGFAARSVDKVITLTGQPAEAGWNSGRTWIDIGFGNGALLLTAREYGYQVKGIDIRPRNVSDIARYNIDAECVDICDGYLGYDGIASVVSMTEVIEHLPFPRMGLGAIARMLGVGGVVLLSTPNLSGALWQHWDSVGSNPFWDEMEHYHIFSRESLYSLLGRCGFHSPRYGISERYSGCMEVIARSGKSLSMHGG